MKILFCVAVKIFIYAIKYWWLFELFDQLKFFLLVGGRVSSVIQLKLKWRSNLMETIKLFCVLQPALQILYKLS